MTQMTALTKATGQAMSRSKKNQIMATSTKGNGEKQVSEYYVNEAVK